MSWAVYTFGAAVAKLVRKDANKRKTIASGPSDQIGLSKTANLRLNKPEQPEMPQIRSQFTR